MKDQIAIACLKQEKYKICFWLTIIYLVDSLISIAFGNNILKLLWHNKFLNSGILCTVIISIGCYIGSFLISKIIALKILYVASALILVPLVSEIYLIIYDSIDSGFIIDTINKGYNFKVGILFIVLMICELISTAIWRLSSPLRRKRNIVLTFIIYMLLCGLIIMIKYDQWIYWLTITEFLLFFLNINLCGMLLKERKEDESIIMQQLICVVNPVGMLFSMHGKTIGTLVYR